jgi:signal peptidase II
VKRSFALLLGVAALVLGLDQWTKRWAEATLAHSPPVNVIGELVRLTFTKNSGVAFGLGAGLPFPYAVFSIAAVVVILVLFARHRVHTLGRQLALALILGGALGNLVDRVTTGEVVDFILIGWRQWYWPVFNVADSAVSIGVVMFGLTWLKHGEAGPTPAYEGRDEARSLDEHVAPGVGPGAESRGTSGPLPRHGADGPVA